MDNMNDSSNPNPNPGNQEQHSQSQGSQSTSGRPFFDSFRSAVNEGAEQARAAAERAVPKIKAALSDATYWTSYGASFAAVFTYTVASELAPESLKKGGRDGAEAGKKAAEGFSSQRKATSNQPEPPPADLGTVVIHT